MTLMRKLFGPSREEIWRRLSGEIGARYVDGGFWKGDKVEASHRDWTVTLDTYAVTTGKVTMVFTRMRAPFTVASPFQFKIYRKGILSDIGKWFGMQDVEVGDPLFDDAFIVKASDESQVRALLQNAKIRELLATQPDIQFMVKDNERWLSGSDSEDVDQLYFSVVGIIKDVDRLKALYDLFAETLDELGRIGAARDGSPS